MCVILTIKFVFKNTSLFTHVKQKRMTVGNAFRLSVVDSVQIRETDSAIRFKELKSFSLVVLFHHEKIPNILQKKKNVY